MCRPLILLLFLALESAVFYLGIRFHPLILVGTPLALVALWWMIANPGFTLLLIIFTDIVKGFLEEGFPFFEVVDYTILVTALVWLGMGKMILEGEWRIPRWSKRILFVYAIFCLVLAISGFYTPSPNYGLVKILRYLIIASSVFVIPFVLIKRPEDSRLLLRHFKILAVILTLSMVGQLLYLAYTGGLVTYLVRVTLLSANPITVSRTLALITSMIMILAIRNSPVVRLALLPVLALLLVAIVSTGSRGPLVSLFVGMLAYSILFENRYRSRLILFSGFAIGLVIALIFTLPESLTTRFFQLAQGDVVIMPGGVKRVSTLGTRFAFWEMSVDTWLSSIENALVGLGAGGFSSLFIWRDFRWYPHNLFLEVLVELGIVGLVTIAVLMGMCLKHLMSQKISGSLTNHSALWVAAMLVMFFAAQFSGDINDNRSLLMLLAISLASVSVDRQEAEVNVRIQLD